jgi:adenylate cyclase
MIGLLKKKITRTLLVSIIISVIVTILFLGGFLNTWESKIQDALYSPTHTLDDIIIVAIDDQSFQDLGRWSSWTRDYYARVINNLNQSSVIGIDVSFFESSKNDSTLAEALKNNKVVLAMEYTTFSHKNGQLFGENLLKPNMSLGKLGQDFETGFVNLYTDIDGVTRTFSPFITGIEDHYHFSMVIVGEYIGSIPNLESSRMLINYFDEPGGYEYISFSDVYNNKIDPEYFKDKIILIGATTPDLHDDVIVPISNKAMPGVEVNANLVQAILTKDFIYHQDDISSIGIIFLLALVTGFLFYIFRIHIATILLTMIIICYIVSAIYIFDTGILMKILYPIITIIAVYIPLVIMLYLTEEKSRKWVTTVFGKYVSPVVIESLLKDPDKLNLGGEKRNITIFFSDIRKFTSISEKLSPEELVNLLNEYLSEMTSIIMKDQGLVDKYMGDAIMAFWGAPLEQSNHPELACSSSLEMIEKLKEIQIRWKENDLPTFDIGIGLNSGDAIVGNMGSFKRFDYTVIGDNVNIASRIEGLNKIYGTNIIISENTYKIIKDKFDTRKLDAVKVKGKKRPILIYELLSKKGKLSETQYKFIKHFEDGLNHYLNRDWKPAVKEFKAALEIKKDKASNLFIARCQDFIKNPPDKDWDGVCTMDTK